MNRKEEEEHIPAQKSKDSGLHIFFPFAFFIPFLRFMESHPFTDPSHMIKSGWLTLSSNYMKRSHGMGLEENENKKKKRPFYLFLT
jgi:hypothetical protein